MSLKAKASPAQTHASAEVVSLKTRFKDSGKMKLLDDSGRILSMLRW